MTETRELRFLSNAVAARLPAQQPKTQSALLPKASITDSTTFERGLALQGCLQVIGSEEEADELEGKYLEIALQCTLGGLAGGSSGVVWGRGGVARGLD